MTCANDDKRRPAISRSKTVKRQRTLFDMLGKKKLEETDFQKINSTTQLIDEAREPQSETSVILPDSTDAIDSINKSVTTPKQRASEIPTFKDQSNIELTSADVVSIEFSDSDVDLDNPSAPFNEESLSGSQRRPIIIDSSPIKSVNHSIEEEPEESRQIPKLEQKKKPVHPFFAPRVKPSNSTVPTSPRRHRTKDVEVLYPDRDSQHIKGDQTLYSSPPCPFARRHANAGTNDIASPAGKTRVHREEDTPVLNFLLLPCQAGEDEDPCDDGIISRITEAETHLESIDQSLIGKHPAIGRAIGAAKSNTGRSPPGQLWTDAWRPTCAKEVLGNEQSAIYLRNWLHTLALELNPTETEDASQKKKRKKKAKKRERVVREVARKKPRRDGLEGFLAEDDDDDDVNPNYWTEDQDELMLGSQESGLDFASDVPEAIKERMRNTILLTGPPGSGKTAAVFACAEELGWEVFEVYPGIGRRNGMNVDNLVGEVGKNHLVTTKVGAVRQVSSDTLAEDNTEATFGQSLILLEEVDVLFKDDVNFWVGVTNLIKQCRRPVICTCNDASLVPMDELPLQRVLHFEPIVPTIATAYLQGMACAEGYMVPPERLMEVYCDTYELAGADVPGEASGQRALPEEDLRRAIHRVQIECSTGGRWSTKNSGSGLKVLEWEREVLTEEEESYMEGWIEKSCDRREEAFRCDDDENGHTVLYSEIGDRDGFARGQVAPGLARGDLRWDLFRARLAYQVAIERTGWLTGPGRESDWTERLPVLREIGRRVLEDEWVERRRTRNSIRTRGLEGVVSVGRPVLAAACSGMEWQRGVAGL